MRVRTLVQTRDHRSTARLRACYPAPRSLAAIEPQLLRRLEEAWAPARAAGVMGYLPLEALRRHASGFILDNWREAVGR